MFSFESNFLYISLRCLSLNGNTFNTQSTTSLFSVQNEDSLHVVLRATANLFPVNENLNSHEIYTKNPCSSDLRIEGR